jgi:hypothetical protein
VRRLESQKALGNESLQAREMLMKIENQKASGRSEMAEGVKKGI